MKSLSLHVERCTVLQNFGITIDDDRIWIAKFQKIFFSSYDIKERVYLLKNSVWHL